MRVNIRFKGKPNFREYHGPVNFLDGESRRVAESTANYLLETFPDYFSLVGKPKISRDIDKAPVDRQVKKAERRGLFKRNKKG